LSIRIRVRNYLVPGVSYRTAEFPPILWFFPPFFPVFSHPPNHNNPVSHARIRHVLNLHPVLFFILYSSSPVLNSGKCTEFLSSERIKFLYGTCNFYSNYSLFLFPVLTSYFLTVYRPRTCITVHSYSWRQILIPLQ
jgi:hypothetical protein